MAKPRANIIISSAFTATTAGQCVENGTYLWWVRGDGNTASFQLQWSSNGAYYSDLDGIVIASGADAEESGITSIPLADGFVRVEVTGSPGTMASGLNGIE